MADGVSDDADMCEARVVYEKLVDGTVSVEDISDVKNRLHKHAESAKMSPRTASLWVQCMSMIDILRKYIRAGRNGNWAVHLQTIQNMLIYLAASGHNRYTKSARVYLQQMANLKEEHPYVRQRFEDGWHVIRRSDRMWAGLSSDLIIEQVLMRSMNNSGELTRVRGVTEQQRLLSLLLMQACAAVNHTRVAQSEFRKILRFRVVAENVYSAQPKRFTRRAAKYRESKVGGGSSRTQYEKTVDSSKNRLFSVEYRDLECNGGRVVAEPNKKKSVDSAINHFFVRRLKLAIQIRRKRIFRRLGIPAILCRNSQVSTTTMMRRGRI